jgi:hypothetical protein
VAPPKGKMKVNIMFEKLNVLSLRLKVLLGDSLVCPAITRVIFIIFGHNES